jgi:flagellar biosynthesis/type III secretory pathway protein FliH
MELAAKQNPEPEEQELVMQLSPLYLEQLEASRQIGFAQGEQLGKQRGKQLDELKGRQDIGSTNGSDPNRFGSAGENSFTGETRLASR